MNTVSGLQKATNIVRGKLPSTKTVANIVKRNELPSGQIRETQVTRLEGTSIIPREAGYVAGSTVERKSYAPVSTTIGRKSYIPTDRTATVTGRRIGAVSPTPYARKSGYIQRDKSTVVSRTVNPAVTVGTSGNYI